MQSDSNRGLTPVIGVAILITITVLLAAVVGFIAIGVSDVTTDIPMASLEWGHNNSGAVYATHQGGEPLQNNDIDIKTTGDASPRNIGSMTAGDTRLVATNADTGDEIRIVYNTSTGPEGHVIASYTVS